ncbi:MAG: hypothetical protein IJ665_04110 [Phocaeicola sp.]|nr:hypothetical protein [Phocaeicola sp.]MBR1595859.1 hypothetical protein [Phocaeicola sp.]
MVVLEIISCAILIIGLIVLEYYIIAHALDSEKPLIQIKEIEISIVDHEENDEKNDGKNDK